MFGFGGEKFCSEVSLCYFGLGSLAFATEFEVGVCWEGFCVVGSSGSCIVISSSCGVKGRSTSSVLALRGDVPVSCCHDAGVGTVERKLNSMFILALGLTLP